MKLPRKQGAASEVRIAKTIRTIQQTSAATRTVFIGADAECISKRRKAMAQEQVREYFRQLGIEDRLIKLHESSATVEQAAEALGTEPRRIAKTMSFLTDDGPIVIVMAGDAKVDNRKYKDRFHIKAKMVPFDDVEAVIGHAAGGVCPFAVNDGVKSYLDVSLKRFETVFPAAGGIHDVTELTCDELEKYSQNFSGWVDVAKGWQDGENT